MKKRLFFTIILIIATVLSGGKICGQTLTVCEGNAVDVYVPVCGKDVNKQGSNSEFVVPAASLSEMSGKMITNMTFYLSTSAESAWGAKYKVYMKEVDNTIIEDLTGPDNTTTVVYTGPLDGTGETMTIEFQEAYQYNGGNLLVGTYVNEEASDYANAVFYGIQTKEWGVSYNDIYKESVFLPKTTFTYEDAPSCPKPSGLNYSDVTNNSAVISWFSVANAFNIKYKRSNDPEWSAPIHADNKSYSLTGLDSGTVYEVQVQAVCGGSDYSDWTASLNFTTDYCEDKDKLSINYTLSDSQEDGWNGAAIKVVDKMTGSIIATLRLSEDDEDPSEGTLRVCQGRVICFNWIKGSYDEECGFEFTGPLGNVILEHVAGEAPSAGTLMEYTVTDSYTEFSTAGNWKEQSNWSNGIPNNEITAVINAACTIPDDYTALANDIAIGENGSITITDGGQLICSNSISAKMQKNIEASTEGASPVNKWYLISSPVNKQAFSDVANLTTATHNIYRYDEQYIKWEEYRDENNEFNIFENGRGYLYRSTTNEGMIEYSGNINTGDVNILLDYICPDESYDGFNLIGNPFTHDIYKGAAGTAIPNGEILEEKYCVLGANGEWILTDDGTAIPAGTAILVQTPKGGDYTIKNTNSNGSGKNRADNDNIWFTVKNAEFCDVACVEFKEGRGFNKMAHYNEDAPMIYINHNGEHFASVDVDDNTKYIDLGFEAKTMGKYTISMKANGSFNYLHLIDKLTNEDVDMLVEDSYTFVGSSSDIADRFIVQLEYEGANNSIENDVFAYQNGTDIIVNGEGELQIFDITGRMIRNIFVNGIETVGTMPQGVYIFRLVGNNIKTQKIVVK